MGDEGENEASENQGQETHLHMWLPCLVLHPGQTLGQSEKNP